MKKKILKIFHFIKQVFQEYIADNVLKYSASLSYYTILSLGPLLVLLISLTSILYKEEAVKGELNDSLKHMIGADAAVQIEKGVNYLNFSSDLTFANVVSGIVLFIGATGIFNEMQDSLNKIWGLRIKARRVWWKLLIDRLISFSLILSLGFVLLVSLALNAIVNTVGTEIGSFFGQTGGNFIMVSNTILSFVITTLLFATILKILPDARIKWKDIFVGAIVTALFFGLGKYVISLYISKSKFMSVYGTAGAILLMMVWVYYSSAIFYLGAVFTKVYATLYGHKIYPTEHSVWIKTEEIPVSDVTLSDKVEL